MTKRTTVTLIAICASLHLPFQLFGQCPPSSAPADSRAVFHAMSRSVVVDAVIIGQQTRVLDQTAFTLYEDGKPQRIASFEFHPAASLTSAGPSGPSSPFDPLGEERSNRKSSQPPSPVNIILIDTLNTGITDQQRNRKQIIAALQALPPGQPVALFSLGTELRMIQGLTESSDVLIRAAAKMNARPSPLYVEHGPDQIREDSSLSGAEFQKQLISAVQSTKDASVKAQIASEGIERALAEQGTRRMDVRVALTLSSLSRLAQFVQAYPGRKRLIWITGSFPLSFQPDVATGFDPSLIREYTPKLQKLETELTNDQIAVYTIDARGLSTSQIDASASTTDAGGVLPGQTQSNLYQSRQEDSLHSTQATLQEIAQSTGGKAYINQNELSQGIREALLDGSAYYSLSYQPTNLNEDGKYRSIELKVDGEKKSQLQYRRGYYALNDPAGVPAADAKAASKFDPDQIRLAFRNAMQQNAPLEDGIIFKANLSRTLASKQTTAEYLIDVSALSAKEQANCGRQLNLVIGAVGWKNADPKPVAAFKVLNSTLNADAFSSVQGSGVRFRQTLEDSTDRSLFRLGVLDLNSGKMGTLDYPIGEKTNSLP